MSGILKPFRLQDLEHKFVVPAKSLKEFLDIISICHKSTALFSWKDGECLYPSDYNFRVWEMFKERTWLVFEKQTNASLSISDKKYDFYLVQYTDETYVNIKLTDYQRVSEEKLNTIFSRPSFFKQ